MRWSFLRSALKAWALAVTSGLLPGQAEPESAPDVFARLGAGEPKEGSVVESGGYCFIRVVRRGARGRNVPDSMLALQGVQSIVRNAALQAASRIADPGVRKDAEAFLLEQSSNRGAMRLGWQIVWSGFEGDCRCLVVAVPSAVLAPGDGVMAEPPTPMGDSPVKQSFVSGPGAYRREAAVDRALVRALEATGENATAMALLYRITEGQEREAALEAFSGLAQPWPTNRSPMPGSGYWILGARFADREAWGRTSLAALFDLLSGSTGSDVMSAMAAAELYVRGYGSVVQEAMRVSGGPGFRDSTIRRRFDPEMQLLAERMDSDPCCLLAFERFLWLGRRHERAPKSAEPSPCVTEEPRRSREPAWLSAIRKNVDGIVTADEWEAGARDLAGLGLPNMALAFVDACLDVQPNHADGHFLRWKCLVILDQEDEATEAFEFLREQGFAERLSEPCRMEWTQVVPGRSRR